MKETTTLLAAALLAILHPAAVHAVEVIKPKISEPLRAAGVNSNRPQIQGEPE